MEIDSFILIGGRSSRFGSDKALATVGGQRVVDMLATAIAAAMPASRITLVAGSNDQLMAGTQLITPVPVIFDLIPGRGPLGGLHAALSYTNTEWGLVLACDLPFVSADLIDLLVNRCQENLDAVVPMQKDGRPQPLCALYRRAACSPLLDEMLHEPRPTPSMQFLLGKLNVEYVPSDEIAELPGSDRLFVNINTPDELENASKLIDAEPAAAA
jgi:molybdopterin-guanine dinucleotide biosynthesis protein A